MAFTGLIYNPGTDANPSSVDQAAAKGQLNTFFWLKKSLIESRKEQFFLPLASTIGMPKHFGKSIKVFEYVPLLDERNINDQGIDAAGATISNKYEIRFQAPVTVLTYATQAHADAVIAENGGTKAGAGPWTVTFGTAKSTIVLTTLGNATNALTSTTGAGGAVLTQLSGNLYGSSKDIGTITSKLPTLTEGGGRVNRVGFTRLQREGSLFKFGFFYEFSKESMDFDSDAELNEHLSRELMTGAVQLTEAVLQKDLLTMASTVVYAGSAIVDTDVTGEDPDGGGAGVPSIVDYSDMMRLSQILTDNRTPKQTKVITGSRLVDTKVIPAGRVMFVGSELVPLLKAMKDLFNNPAFVAVQHYADAGTVLNGEIGTIDEFRIVQVPEMLHWAGQGASVSSNPGYRATNGKYDIYPMLVVGDDSFTTIGFQTDGKSAKFSVITKMPGSDTADRNDPYGETGFSSLKWYYGILVKRPERLGLIKTVAPV